MHFESTGTKLYFPASSFSRIHPPLLPSSLSLLQIPFNSTALVQQLGRSHRSNQVSGPEYKAIITSLPGEIRFAAVRWVGSKRGKEEGKKERAKIELLYVLYTYRQTATYSHNTPPVHTHLQTPTRTCIHTHFETLLLTSPLSLSPLAPLLSP